jgi:hypothetical protein
VTVAVRLPGPFIDCEHSDAGAGENVQVFLLRQGDLRRRIGALEEK